MKTVILGIDRLFGSGYSVLQLLVKFQGKFLRCDFPDDFLTIIDESHVSVPQIRAMYNGDQARKTKLVDYGFRLPSAKDNRPLKFDEFNAKVKQIVYCSATPGDYEYEQAKTVAEQVIRPTGLLDPEIEIRPLANQIDDLIAEIHKVVEAKDRVFVTTLTKRSAEDLSQYLHEAGIRVEYLHSDIDAIERVAILQRLRKGEFDVLVGINLLREGLDLPEVALVAILDADKEGFLRSEMSLVQTIGRAARNVEGTVIMYADSVTPSMERAIGETYRRREKQMKYNAEHGIVPQTIVKGIRDVLEISNTHKTAKGDTGKMSAKEKNDLIERLTKEMKAAAKILDFENAAYIRDKIAKIKNGE